jgi:RimJ/RimL family protein N-acetyltransferase
MIQERSSPFGLQENEREMIELNKLEDKYLPDLWEIVKSYPGYFDDRVDMKSLEDFKYYMKKNSVDGMVGIKDGEVIGCGYIEKIHNRMACVSIFSKRHMLDPKVMLEILRSALLYYFYKYDLKYIYAVVRENNRAIIKLLKALGFGGVQELPAHERINGKPIDCKLFGLLRESLKREEAAMIKTASSVRPESNFNILQKSGYVNNKIYGGY